MREKISVCITAGNEEHNIRRCLESAKWADEIVVVDSLSTDRTVEICKEYTGRIHRQAWLGYVAQKSLAIDLTTGPWVLLMDSDEEVSAELKEEMLRELESPSSQQYCGYEFSRRVHYLGRWIGHGEFYPDIKLRLFRKARGRCVGEDPHDRIVVDGRVKRLRSDLYHYTYRGISDHVATINKFATITAEVRHAAGRKARMRDILLRPPIRFVRGYCLRRGFLDGFPGLLIAVMAGYGVFLKYSKLWELQHSGQPAQRTTGNRTDENDDARRRVA